MKRWLAILVAVMGSLADRTRTRADNLMVAILKANEERLTDALVSLVSDPVQPPTSERVSAALEAVGIRV